MELDGCMEVMEKGVDIWGVNFGIRPYDDWLNQHMEKSVNVKGYGEIFGVQETYVQE